MPMHPSRPHSLTRCFIGSIHVDTFQPVVETLFAAVFNLSASLAYSLLDLIPQISQNTPVHTIFLHISLQVLFCRHSVTSEDHCRDIRDHALRNILWVNGTFTKMSRRVLTFLEMSVFRRLIISYKFQKYQGVFGLYTDDKSMLDLPQYLLTGYCVEIPQISLLDSGFVISISSKNRALQGHIRTDRYLWFGDRATGLAKVQRNVCILLIVRLAISPSLYRDEFLVTSNCNV